MHKWDIKELKLLKKFWPCLEKEKLLKKFPGRTWHRISSKACTLKLSRNAYREYKIPTKDERKPYIRDDAWTVVEINKLKKFYSKSTKEVLLKKFPKRTWSAIIRFANTLELRRDNIWTTKEINIISKYDDINIYKNKLVKLLPNRSWGSILKRRSYLKAIEEFKNI